MQVNHVVPRLYFLLEISVAYVIFSLKKSLICKVTYNIQMQHNLMTDMLVVLFLYCFNKLIVNSDLFIHVEHYHMVI